MRSILRRFELHVFLFVITGLVWSWPLISIVSGPRRPGAALGYFLGTWLLVTLILGAIGVFGLAPRGAVDPATGDEDAQD